LGKEESMELREADLSDVPGILAIYNEVIANSTAIYSEEPSSLDERMAWFKARRSQGYPVLVATSGQEILAFSSFGDFRAWPCYRYTVEHTVHVQAERRGQGLGRRLLEALIPRAAALGKHVLIAGIDADNAASIRLHQRLQFKQVAHFQQVGRKFDRWLDLVFMQRLLSCREAFP
jgi:L-amino acid N-acyltransferase YncA